MKRLCLSIVPLLLLAFTLPGFAQTVTGAVRGTVTDATGAIVAGATVTATNAATGVKTVATAVGEGLATVGDPTDGKAIRIFVDPKSFIYLHGMVLDFEETLMRQGFNFINPNSTKSCGCGSSFTA